MYLIIIKTKQCPNCQSANYTIAYHCWECGDSEYDKELIDRFSRTDDKKKEKKNRCDSYHLFVEHIYDSFKSLKNVSYPFRAEDGMIVKRLLGLYSVEQLMAFWDLFLGQSWDWKEKDTGRLVRVAHDLRQFQAKITRLIDDPRWRTMSKKYEESNKFPVELKTGGIVPVPDKPLHEKKIEQLYALKEAVENGDIEDEEVKR